MWLCVPQMRPYTLFHKVKFPLLKAFYIVYFVAASKKGISSTELSRKLGLYQKDLLVLQTQSDESHGEQWRLSTYRQC
jgi:hypothetical protein